MKLREKSLEIMRWISVTVGGSLPLPNDMFTGELLNKGLIGRIGSNNHYSLTRAGVDYLKELDGEWISSLPEPKSKLQKDESMITEVTEGDILTGLELLEIQLKRNVTIKEIAEIIYPDKPLPEHFGYSSEYQKVYSILSKLQKRGLVEREKGRGMEPYGYKLTKMQRDKSYKKMMSINPVVIGLTDILQSLRHLYVNHPEGITAKILSDHFPEIDIEKLRIKLNTLESEGLLKSRKISNTKYYELSPNSELPLTLPTNKQSDVKITKARLFPCDVCPDIIIPAPARPSLYLVVCNICQSNYLVEGDTAFRLGLGIKIEVWHK